jgi:hypothetical protein
MQPRAPWRADLRTPPSRAGLENLQHQYVRYQGQVEAKQSDEGWTLSESEANFTKMHGGDDSVSRERYSTSGGLPQQVQLNITSAPAEFCLPMKNDRQFKPHFQARLDSDACVAAWWLAVLAHPAAACMRRLVTWASQVPDSVLLLTTASAPKLLRHATCALHANATQGATRACTAAVQPGSKNHSNNTKTNFAGASACHALRAAAPAAAPEGVRHHPGRHGAGEHPLRPRGSLSWQALAGCAVARRMRRVPGQYAKQQDKR